MAIFEIELTKRVRLIVRAATEMEALAAAARADIDIYSDDEQTTHDVYPMANGEPGYVVKNGRLVDIEDDEDEEDDEDDESETDATEELPDLPLPGPVLAALGR